MIEQPEAMPLLASACPSFAEEWSEHVREHGAEMAYVAAGAFAAHLLSLYRANEVTCFPAVAAVIERLHIEGSPWVKEFATIGVLEAVQNVWGNNDADPNAFCRFLGKESQWWWQSLNAFWSGKVPHVGYRDA
jgi:hypothetical protein